MNDDTKQPNTLDDIIAEEDAPSTSAVPEPSEGGTVLRSHTNSENSESMVGALGHPGTDEGTE